MDDIALLLKSYAADAAYAERLVATFHEFNTDRLIMHVVVPRVDLAAFDAFACSTLLVHAEEDVASSHLVTESIHGLSAGYINQEIVKLSFWESGLAANYFCVDSDAIFLRPFGRADFMRDNKTPYSVLVQDNEVKVEPRYFHEHWQGREQAIRTIMDTVGLDDPIIRTCHGHQVFSAAVLESFKDDFLAPRNWTYADALRVAPYEFSWYCMWLQKSRVIPIHAIEPLVKVFHNEDEHLAYILLGVTPVDLARAYVAVVVNSNYSRQLGMVTPTQDKSTSLAPYLSYQEVAGLITAKVKDTWIRRTGGSGS